MVVPLPVTGGVRRGSCCARVMGCLACLMGISLMLAVFRSAQAGVPPAWASGGGGPVDTRHGDRLRGWVAHGLPERICMNEQGVPCPGPRGCGGPVRQPGVSVRPPCLSDRPVQQDFFLIEEGENPAGREGGTGSPSDSRHVGIAGRCRGDRWKKRRFRAGEGETLRKRAAALDRYQSRVLHGDGHRRGTCLNGMTADARGHDVYGGLGGSKTEQKGGNSL